MITGGKSYVSSSPSFSSDGKKLLLCTGDTVSIFSTTTGLLISELEGHTGRVTSVIVVPVEPNAVKFMCYCWTASLDGTIRYWDFASGEIIRTVDVKLPIYSMAILGLLSDVSAITDKKSSLYAFLSVEDTSKPAEHHKALRGRIQVCDLSTSRKVGGLLTETRKPDDITLSPSKEYLGIRNKRKIHIWKIPTKKFSFNDIKMIKLHHTKNITVLAFHPTERIIAGGDVTGRILVWRGFGSRKFLEIKDMDHEEVVNKGDDDADFSPTTWHWHAKEVKFLSFSSDGSHLYSGGQEGVIVVWQLDTGKRKFKPRLGSPLYFFVQSPDLSLCCVSCADNRVHLLKMPSMELLKSISGIKAPFLYPMKHGELGKRLSCSSATGVVALSAENYCIQLFSLYNHKEISQVQVCERNYHPVEDTMVVISLVALSFDGSFIGTVENKLPEDGIGDLICLKFWVQGAQAGDCRDSYYDGEISDLAFHPHNKMSASCSYGGDFKIWVCRSDSQQNSLTEKLGWRCQSIGSFKFSDKEVPYRKRPMTAAAFSADGSVLSIAAETVVTLWDPNTNVLVAVVGESIAPIGRLSFVGNSDYLITVSQGQKPQLIAWNMSKLVIDWSYELLTEDISSQDGSSQFAVLALGSKQLGDSTARQQDGFILIFTVQNPTPIAIWCVKKAKGGHIAFVQTDPSFQHQKVTDELHPSTMLAYINGDHEYVIFDPLKDEKEVLQIDKRSRESNDILEETERSGYFSIYGKLSESNRKIDEIPEACFEPSERPWETIFSGSSHILPPLTKLCSFFLESLLEKKIATE